jgi:hypothetical protein
MVDKLSKEELLKVLAKVATPVKQRKKYERNEEQQKELDERLAKMRETAQANRAIKKEKKLKEALEAEEAAKKQPKSKVELAIDIAKGSNNASNAREDIFEKKYGNVFEKLTDSMGRLENHFSEIKQLKISKAEQRKLEKEAAAAVAAVAPVVPVELKIESIKKPQSSINRNTLYEEPEGTPYIAEPKYVASIPNPTTHVVENIPFKFNDYKKMTFGKKR